MSDPRTRMVGDGYDVMADHFADWRDRIVADPRDWWTEQLTTPEGWVGEWLGTTMFFSSFPPERNSRLLEDAGFELSLDELGTMQEPEGEVAFQWVLAQR